MTENLTTTNEFGVNVGDIFYTSWGYDQTNVNYYKVIRVTAKSAEVVPIGSHIVEAHGPGGNQIEPNPDYVCEWDVLIGVNRGDEKKSKLCKVKSGYQGEATIVLESGRHWAYRYKGGTQYETDSMWGH